MGNNTYNRQGGKNMTKYLKYIFLFLAILTTVFIFANSLKNGSESANISNPITDTVVDVVEGITDKPQNRDSWSYFIRKCAHFVEFALCGGLWMLSLYFFGLKRYYLYAFLIAVTTAVIDEGIQMISEGRVSSFLDVLIDSSGAFVSIGIMTLIIWLRKKRVKEIN